MRVNFKAVGAGSLAACATLMTIVVVLYARPAAGAQPPAAADPAVITAWNATAVSTIAGPPPNGAGKANAEAFLWFGFVQAAVYNAVNGITGEYELYEWNARAPKGASPQAAAAAAAHGVLMEYFGTDDFVNSEAIAANLNAALATSLGQIPDGVPKQQGIRYGERAAERLVELREDDGRFAPIVFNVPPAAGVWRPTPPAMAPFFDPWLGQVEPLVLDSPSQFRPGPPPAISSALYVEEFEEVRDYGVNVGSLRTPAQTQTALFFSDTGIGPLQAGLRDLVTRRGLDISDSARLFAAVDLSIADTSICGLGRQVPLRMVAPDHRDPRGRYRRQSQYRRSSRMDSAPRHAALSGLAERSEWRHRCRQHGPLTAERGRPGRPEPHVRRGGSHAALRLCRRHPARRGRRARLLRHSLPHRRRGRHRDGNTGRELGARPPLRTDELDRLALRAGRNHTSARLGRAPA